ncbi:hypothetical protein T11_5619, partial [Trichinella zimbabwensis]
LINPFIINFFHIFEFFHTYILSNCLNLCSIMTSDEESTNYNWQLEVVNLMNSVNKMNVSVANSLDEMSEITEQLALLLKDTTASACDSADSAVRVSCSAQCSLVHLASLMADHSNTSLENGVLAKHVRVVDSDMPTKLIMASAKIGLWALKKNINLKDISRLIVDIFSKTTNNSSWGCIVGKNVVLGAEYYGMYFMHFVIDDYTFFLPRFAKIGSWMLCKTIVIWTKIFNSPTLKWRSGSMAALLNTMIPYKATIDDIVVKIPTAELIAYTVADTSGKQEQQQQQGGVFILIVSSASAWLIFSWPPKQSIT